MANTQQDLLIAQWHFAHKAPVVKKVMDYTVRNKRGAVSATLSYNTQKSMIAKLLTTRIAYILKHNSVPYKTSEIANLMGVSRRTLLYYIGKRKKTKNPNWIETVQRKINLPLIELFLQTEFCKKPNERNEKNEKNEQNDNKKIRKANSKRICTTI